MSRAPPDEINFGLDIGPPVRLNYEFCKGCGKQGLDCVKPHRFFTFEGWVALLLKLCQDPPFDEYKVRGAAQYAEEFLPGGLDTGEIGRCIVCRRTNCARPHRKYTREGYAKYQIELKGVPREEAMKRANEEFRVFGGDWAWYPQNPRAEFGPQKEYDAPTQATAPSPPPDGWPEVNDDRYVQIMKTIRQAWKDESEGTSGDALLRLRDEFDQRWCNMSGEETPRFHMPWDDLPRPQADPAGVGSQGLYEGSGGGYAPPDTGYGGMPNGQSGGGYPGQAGPSYQGGGQQGNPFAAYAGIPGMPNIFVSGSGGAGFTFTHHQGDQSQTYEYPPGGGAPRASHQHSDPNQQSPPHSHETPRQSTSAGVGANQADEKARDPLDNPFIQSVQWYAETFLEKTKGQSAETTRIWKETFRKRFREEWGPWAKTVEMPWDEQPGTDSSSKLKGGGSRGRSPKERSTRSGNKSKNSSRRGGREQFKEFSNAHADGFDERYQSWKKSGAPDEDNEFNRRFPKSRHESSSRVSNADTDYDSDASIGPNTPRVPRGAGSDEYEDTRRHFEEMWTDKSYGTKGSELREARKVMEYSWLMRTGNDGKGELMPWHSKYRKYVRRPSGSESAAERKEANMSSNRSPSKPTETRDASAAGQKNGGPKLYTYRSKAERASDKLSRVDQIYEEHKTKCSIDWDEAREKTSGSSSELKKLAQIHQVKFERTTNDDRAKNELMPWTRYLQSDKPGNGDRSSKADTSSNNPKPDSPKWNCEADTKKPSQPAPPLFGMDAKYEKHKAEHRREWESASKNSRSETALKKLAQVQQVKFERTIEDDRAKSEIMPWTKYIRGEDNGAREPPRPPKPTPPKTGNDSKKPAAGSGEKAPAVLDKYEKTKKEFSKEWERLRATRMTTGSTVPLKKLAQQHQVKFENAIHDERTKTDNLPWTKYIYDETKRKSDLFEIPKEPKKPAPTNTRAGQASRKPDIDNLVAKQPAPSAVEANLQKYERLITRFNAEWDSLCERRQGVSRRELAKKIQRKFEKKAADERAKTEGMPWSHLLEGRTATSATTPAASQPPAIPKTTDVRTNSAPGPSPESDEKSAKLKADCMDKWNAESSTITSSAALRNLARVHQVKFEHWDEGERSKSNEMPWTKYLRTLPSPDRNVPPPSEDDFPKQGLSAPSRELPSQPGPLPELTLDEKYAKHKAVFVEEWQGLSARTKSPVALRKLAQTLQLKFKHMTEDERAKTELMPWSKYLSIKPAGSSPTPAASKSTRSPPRRTASVVPKPSLPTLDTKGDETKPTKQACHRSFKKDPSKQPTVETEPPSPERYSNSDITPEPPVSVPKSPKQKSSVKSGAPPSPAPKSPAAVSGIQYEMLKGKFEMQWDNQKQRLAGSDYSDAAKNIQAAFEDASKNLRSKTEVMPWTKYLNIFMPAPAIVDDSADAAQKIFESTKPVGKPMRQSSVNHEPPAPAGKVSQQPTTVPTRPRVQKSAYQRKKEKFEMEWLLLQENVQGNDFSRPAQNIQKAFETEAADERAKTEVMPWTMYLPVGFGLEPPSAPKPKQPGASNSSRPVQNPHKPKVQELVPKPDENSPAPRQRAADGRYEKQKTRFLYEWDSLCEIRKGEPRFTLAKKIQKTFERKTADERAETEVMPWTKYLKQSGVVEDTSFEPPQLELAPDPLPSQSPQRPPPQPKPDDVPQPRQSQPPRPATRKPSWQDPPARGEPSSINQTSPSKQARRQSPQLSEYHKQLALFVDDWDRLKDNYPTADIQKLAETIQKGFESTVRDERAKTEQMPWTRFLPDWHLRVPADEAYDMRPKKESTRQPPAQDYPQERRESLKPEAAKDLGVPPNRGTAEYEAWYQTMKQKAAAYWGERFLNHEGEDYSELAREFQGAFEMGTGDARARTAVMPWTVYLPATSKSEHHGKMKKSAAVEQQKGPNRVSTQRRPALVPGTEHLPRNIDAHKPSPLHARDAKSDAHYDKCRQKVVELWFRKHNVRGAKFRHLMRAAKELQHKFEVESADPRAMTEVMPWTADFLPERLETAKKVTPALGETHVEEEETYEQRMARYKHNWTCIMEVTNAKDLEDAAREIQRTWIEYAEDERASDAIMPWQKHIFNTSQESAQTSQSKPTRQVSTKKMKVASSKQKDRSSKPAKAHPKDSPTDYPMKPKNGDDDSDLEAEPVTDDEKEAYYQNRKTTYMENWAFDREDKDEKQLADLARRTQKDWVSRSKDARAITEVMPWQKYLTKAALKELKDLKPKPDSGKKKMPRPPTNIRGKVPDANYKLNYDFYVKHWNDNMLDKPFDNQVLNATEFRKVWLEQVGIRAHDERMPWDDVLAAAKDRDEDEDFDLLSARHGRHRFDSIRDGAGEDQEGVDWEQLWKDKKAAEREERRRKEERERRRKRQQNQGCAQQ